MLRNNDSHFRLSVVECAKYQVAYSKNGLKVEVHDVLRTLRQVSATVRTLCLEDDL